MGAIKAYAMEMLGEDVNQWEDGNWIFEDKSKINTEHEGDNADAWLMDEPWRVW